MNKKLMAEASQFQSSHERKGFWWLIIGVLTAALTLFVFFNFF